MKTEIPLLKFDTDMQFHQALDDKAYEIHCRTLYAIDYAFNTDKDEVTIAYLNDRDTLLGAPKDVWLDNLQMSMDYFIDIEAYEKCQEVKQLMDKLQP